MQKSVAVLALALLARVPVAHAQGVTRVEAFTPTGDVGSVQQVHAQFSDFLFPLGAEKGQPAPFDSDCERMGKGRWLNPKEWVFEFTDKLPARLTCAWKAREGLKSVKGLPVVGAPEFKFVVSPPEIEAIIPRFVQTEKEITDGRGERIDPDQAFVIHFDKKISAEEIVHRYSFHVEGRKEAIGVKFLNPETLKKIVSRGREYIRPQPNETWVVIQPALELPNRENLLVMMSDRETGTQRYWQTRPFFKAEFTCSRDNVRAPCSPVAQVELSFNSPVSVEQIRKMRVTSKASGARDVAATPTEGYAGAKSSHDDRAIFKGPFKAGATYRVELPKGLSDIRGRTLSNAKSFPLEFGTDGLPALAKFPGSFGVLEAEQPVLPLSLRNIEKSIRIGSARIARFQPAENARSILKWLKRVENQGSRYSSGDESDKRDDQKAYDFRSVLTTFAKDVSGKVDRRSLPVAGESNQAEVVGIPLEDGGKPRFGLHIVELESTMLANRILDRKDPFYTSTAVLVTNLGVHFKWGQAGPSLVWVTELKTGQPVEGAEVAIEDCYGKNLARGKTAADGTLQLEKLPSESSLSSSCGYEHYHGTKLVVMAHKGDDFSFTLDSWSEGLESWRFNVGSGYYSGDSGADEWTAHTVLARDFLKPGQTVNMKHYVRQFHWKGFLLPKNLPKFVIIKHEGSEETWNLPVKFDANGIAVSNWTLPETAKLGTYSISLATELPKKGSAFRPHLTRTGSFEVQEFRLPTLGVAIRIPDPITAELARDPNGARISLQGMYLSGGPASQLPMELRFQRKPAPKQARTLGDFVYSQDEAVKTGIVDKKEDSYGDSEFDGEDGEGGVESRPAAKTDDGVMASKLLVKANLDAGGAATVPMPREVLDTDSDGEVYVALNYSDPNGEIHSMVRSTSVFSRDRYLGLHKDFHAYSSDGKPIKASYSLATPAGTPIPGETIRVELYQKIDYTHRERLVGGFYGYRTTTETKKIGEVCAGKTSTAGTLDCVFPVPAAGTYLLQASARDSRGKDLVYTRELSVYGSGGETEGYSESDRMTLVPNQEEYEAGDTAEIAVQSSFQSSQVLVTYEREGVMEHQVVSLSGAQPLLKLPIKAEHSPNVVISAFAVRGRIAEPAPTGLLDLAKPAFKLGMVRLKIGKKGHQLPVTVKTDQSSYPVRSKVEVTIETQPGAELALAVVDKALLKLKPNTTWDLLNAMITERSHRVQTATLQMNLIGKRHYGKKATPFGGGGGNLMSRELLDSLVAWKPSLKADAHGRITTDFKLNDAISGFVVVAIGTEGLNRFGTGKTEIVSTQDLQILSSVPPVLRERDRLPVQFVVRNTTVRPLHVKASLQIEKDAARTQDLVVAPQSAAEVRFEDRVPMDVKSRAYTLTAIASEGPQDKLKVTSKVVEVLPVRVIEGYLQQLSAQESKLPVKFPADATPDKGGYRVQVQARLSEVPDSVLRYMSAYPFSCFEQQTSRAMALRDIKMWRQQWKSLQSYLDSNGLIKYFPEMRYGSLDLTAYVLTIAAEAGKNQPELALTHKSFNPANLQRLLEAVRRGMRGEIRVSQTWWPSYVDANERIAAGEALSLYEPIQPADYEALKSVREKNNLSHALSLLAILSNSPKTLEKSMGDLNAYANEVLTHYQFENTHLRLRDARFWFMGSLSATPDGLKARTLIHLLASEQKDNATKLLRALIEDLRTGYFDTTPGNAWGVVGLERFRRKYEAGAVAGTVKVALGAGAGAFTRSVAVSERKPKAEAFVPVKAPAGASELRQTYAGSGSPWSFTLVEAARPLTESVDHGFVLRKSVELVNEAKNGVHTRGDLYRVKLEIESRSPQSWAVVLDPVPTGASIVSTESSGGGSIAFEERRMDRMQVFYEYLPEGKSEFRYLVRLNQTGEFEFPPTRVEAMYDPTQYGESPNAKAVIGE